MAAENATLAAKDTAPYLKDGGLELDRVRTEQDRGISIVVPQILWKSVPGDLVGWKTVACEPACRYKFREEVFSRKMGGGKLGGGAVVQVLLKSTKDLQNRLGAHAKSNRH
jgi:hypothetical protein